MPADTDTFPSTRNANSVGPQAIYRARALAALNLNPLDPLISEYFEDFNHKISPTTLATWTRSVTGSANFASVAGAGGGWNRFTTGATAGSVSEAYADGSGQVGNISTDRWYLATRFRIPTTPDAASILCIGWGNQAGGKTTFVGFNGPRNAANFTLQYDGNGAAGAGSSLNLGPIDTAVHIVEIYGQGSASIKARFDGGAELSVTQGSAPADFLYHYITARNGVTAANQNLDVDWLMSMATRSP